MELLNIRSIIVLIYISIHVNCLFPGAEPDEGDIRHIYPYIYIGIGFGDHSHTIPYLFGWLENLSYPKDRIKLELFMGQSEDATIHQVRWWIDSTKSFFKSVKLNEFNENDVNWLEKGLRNARLQKTSKCLLLSGDTIPIDYDIIQHIFNEPKHIVVIPLLNSIDGTTNIEDVSEELRNRKNVREEITSFGIPLAIDLLSTDSSYLTFDAQNLPFYEGADDPELVFIQSCKNMDISIWADNQINYGIYINPSIDLEDRRNMIRYHLADIIADYKSVPIISRSVRPYTPETSKYGVDKIYVINLKRREERLNRMKKIFELLGIEFEHIEATDGQLLENLPDDLKSYKILEGYIDPISKRPMKKGEIGCFLSHYRIWKDVVEKKYEKVIVFEDDLRFSYNGLKRIEEVLEDLEASKKSWDLIYLGRKKQSDKEELWIKEHRHLSSVEYSYWTLGYMLSQSGANKLSAPNPLNNIIPVDEYLPIMFDKHPNQQWSKYYEPRDLEAFTLYPLVVFPQKYTNEPGYISDTEDSVIIIHENNDKSEL